MTSAPKTPTPWKQCAEYMPPRRAHLNDCDATLAVGREASWAHRGAFEAMRIQPVSPLRRTEKKLRTLGRRISGRHALEAVPDDRIASRHAIDREIAFEHAARRAEEVDGRVHVSLLPLRHLLGAPGSVGGDR